MDIRVIYLTLLLLLTVTACRLTSYRTSSKERFERATLVALPDEFVVLKDEYQDMWQDYCVLYDIKLSKRSAVNLSDKIRRSPYFNPGSFHNGAWETGDFITVDSISAVWARSPAGYDFTTLHGRVFHRANFDTVTNILSYEECAD